MADYLNAEGISEFYMSSYTINDPRAYGLDYTPLPPWPDAPPVLPQRFNPSPGVYAISTTQLQGVVVADPEMYDCFRHLEPVARIGHAMFVYELGATVPVSWVAQCTVPVAPLPSETLREGLGIGEDIPLLAFDCEQSWVIPPGSGRYVVVRGVPTFPWGIWSDLRLAYEQKRTGFVPPFAVYEWDNPSTPPTPPITAVPSLAVGESLTFLGYGRASLQAGERGTMETWWRIEARPKSPLSLMAHLVDRDGTLVAVGDGLGLAGEHWLPGSILIQRHALEIPIDAAPGSYALQIGAYTLSNLEQLPVAAGESQIGDHAVVGSLEIVAP